MGSAVLLYELLAEGKRVDCVTFNCWQHREVMAAKSVVHEINMRKRVLGESYIRHDIIDLRELGKQIGGKETVPDDSVMLAVAANIARLREILVVIS